MYNKVFKLSKKNEMYFLGINPRNCILFKINFLVKGVPERFYLELESKCCLTVTCAGVFVAEVRKKIKIKI